MKTKNLKTIKDVEKVLGRPARSIVHELLTTTLNGNLSNIYANLQNLYNDGYSPSIITESLLQEGQQILRNQFDGRLLELLKELLKVELSPNKSLALEICLINLANTGSLPASNTIVQAPEPEFKESLKPVEEPKKKKSSEAAQKSGPINSKVKPIDNFDEKWKMVLESIKSTHNTLYGILRNAGALFSEKEGGIILSFRYPFHLKKASENNNQIVINNALKSTGSEEYRLIFKKQEKEPVKKTVSAVKTSTDSVLSSVIDVFGGGEVVK